MWLETALSADDSDEPNLILRLASEDELLPSWQHHASKTTTSAALPEGGHSASLSPRRTSLSPRTAALPADSAVSAVSGSGKLLTFFSTTAYDEDAFTLVCEPEDCVRPVFALLMARRLLQAAVESEGRDSAVLLTVPDIPPSCGLSPHSRAKPHRPVHAAPDASTAMQRASGC